MFRNYIYFLRHKSKWSNDFNLLIWFFTPKFEGYFLTCIFASRLIDERQNDPQKFLQQLGGDTAQLGGDTAKENAEAVTRG